MTMPTTAFGRRAWRVGALMGAAALLAFSRPGAADGPPKAELRLMTLDPGHFHAALVHRDAYPGIANRVHVYAPVGPDLVDHLKRVTRFNTRADAPTRWELEVHAGPDFLTRLRREHPGDVVVISGRNRGKIDYVQTAVGAGVHALVDKPWVLRSEDLPKLADTLALARRKGRIAFDMMTERFEVTTALQRALVNDPEVFGQIAPGTPERPGVYMESVHHLMKTVAGAPNLRPAWFFDREQQGEGVNDIGTHLVDLVPWTLWPEQVITAEKDIEMISAQRWPTAITREQFQRVTGEKDFPAFLAKDVNKGTLDYFANTLVVYKIRGVHTKLNVIWDWEAPAGAGDSHFAYYQGTRARIEIRQGAAEKHRPELYVIPQSPADREVVLRALERRVASLQTAHPGVAVDAAGAELRVTIPEALRTVHEDHFGEVARAFFGYVRDPKTFPKWEHPNMLAKYHVTTAAAELSRKTPAKVAARIAPR